MTTPTDAELIEWLRLCDTAYKLHAPAVAEGQRRAADRLAALADENERLSLIIRSQARKMHRWKPALEKYADEKNWACTDYDTLHEHSENNCWFNGWELDGHGYDIAREALKEPNDAN